MLTPEELKKAKVSPMRTAVVGAATVGLAGLTIGAGVDAVEWGELLGTGAEEGIAADAAAVGSEASAASAAGEEKTVVGSAIDTAGDVAKGAGEFLGETWEGMTPWGDEGMSTGAKIGGGAGAALGAIGGANAASNQNARVEAARIAAENPSSFSARLMSAENGQNISPERRALLERYAALSEQQQGPQRG
jgi:hypothetical protein